MNDLIKLPQETPKSIIKTYHDHAFTRTTTRTYLPKTRVRFSTYVEVFTIPCMEQTQESVSPIFKKVHFATNVEVFTIPRLDEYEIDKVNDLYPRKRLSEGKMPVDSLKKTRSLIALWKYRYFMINARLR